MRQQPRTAGWGQRAQSRGAAAGKGHLLPLQLLHELGKVRALPWNPRAAANAAVAPQRQQHRWRSAPAPLQLIIGAAGRRRRRRRNKLHKEKFANQFSVGEYESVGPGGAAGMPVAERTLRLRLTLHCRCQSTLAELFTPHYSLLHTSQRPTHSCTPQKCWAKGYNVAGDNGNYVERGSALEASMSGWMLCTIQHL